MTNKTVLIGVDKYYYSAVAVNVKKDGAVDVVFMLSLNSLHFYEVLMWNNSDRSL
jgi:hypothetical protein